MTAVAKKLDKGRSGFGGRLNALRIQAGYTLTELGELADMAYTAIGRLERGEREPTWSTVLKLAAALGVSSAAFEMPPIQLDKPDPTELPGRPLGKRK